MAAQKKMLVVYYSWSNGNTERVAKQLAEACGADLERIETVVPYPEDYDTTVAQAQDEVNAGFEPEIAPLEHNPANYDVIAVGTPTWWYTMAPAVATFMRGVDWPGKTVVAFQTNGGWPGHTIDDIEEIAEGAVAGPALEVAFDSTGGPNLVSDQTEIDAWIEQVSKLF